MKRLLLPLLGLVVLLSGCASKENSGRYSLKQDRGPDRAVDLSQVPDAVPRHEPHSRWGNKSPYKVLGKRYYVLPSADGYRERGIASWYGKKFHGHTTSNGEVYDMYQMSAAHKSLPLPSFVRVTNLDNNRQVVVRVNDRGPFHDRRLIDLSYAAAYRLGMLQTGTARVEVEAITPGQNDIRMLASQGRSAVSSDRAAITGRTLQVAALSSAVNANGLAERLQSLLQEPARVVGVERGDRMLYRVHLGPLTGQHTLNWLLQQLSQAGYPGAHLVDLP
ncbi:septal ring lytic transglycosylase RlpA family protein [Marinobacterium sp. AK62]|uniref:Endolytic peptidoglycan transglycosylase RlpA n=1 Tax=Marinobacterium alkalitolerans TaxID=1542925 RepID=A0ABS3Z8Z7_9GAMM|nr:septal ring lytic transglycosylase RlpA family protein [Marinobacterium alkalitolerans]MBP0048186.1 septal ring lytic transglycosylase RlpA family protein [Marinobacterium alkalitolerans]